MLRSACITIVTIIIKLTPKVQGQGSWVDTWHPAFTGTCVVSPGYFFFIPNNAQYVSTYIGSCIRVHMETIGRLRWTSPRRRRVTNSEFVRQSGSQVTSEMWGTHGGAIRLALLKAGSVGCMYMALWSKVIYFFTISIPTPVDRRMFGFCILIPSCKLVLVKHMLFYMWIQIK